MAAKSKKLSERLLGSLDAPWLTRLGNLVTLLWVIPLLFGVGSWLWLRGLDLLTIITIAIGVIGLVLQAAALLRKPERTTSNQAESDALGAGATKQSQGGVRAPDDSTGGTQAKPLSQGIDSPKAGSLHPERLSDVLQKQLNRGRSLQRNTPAMAEMASLKGSVTTAADVDVWIQRTRRKLEPTPLLLADFEYKPNPGPFSFLLRPRTFAPEFKERLDLRVATLAEIVADLRRQGK